MLVPLIKKLHNYLLAWAWPTRIILLLLIILVGVALGYLTDIRLLQNKLAKQTKNLSQLEMQTRKEQELIINVKAEEKQLINWAKNYLLSVTPSAMLNFLILMVKQEAVTLLWLKPGSFQCDDKFCVYPFELSLSGKYQNLIRCISAMLAAPYLTAISNLKIEKLNYNVANNLSNEHTPLILNLKVLFYQNSSRNFIFTSQKQVPVKTLIKREQVPINTLAFRDLFTIEPKLKIDDDLSDWEWEDLKMLGCIKKVGQVVGVVVDPVGKIYSIVVGTKIGRQQSHVEAVTCEKVTIKNGEGSKQVNIIND